MTVAVNDAWIQSTAVGGETTLQYDFPVIASSHLVVTLTRSGTTTTLVESTDYTVSGVGDDSGGNITMAGAYAGGLTAGDVVTRYREVPIARTTDYQTSGDFLAATVNDEQDQQYHILQELDRNVDRCLQLDKSSSVTLAALPDPVDGKYLRGNAAEDGWENVSITDPDTYVDPLTTRGDLLYMGASAAQRLAKGAQGSILEMGANDPQWLALGSKGQKLQAGASNSSWVDDSGAVNWVLNGGLGISLEHGDSHTVADDDYTCGDFFNYIGENNATVTRISTTSLGKSKYYLRVNHDNANAQAGLCYFLNAEDTAKLWQNANGVVSFSFSARTVSGAEISNLRAAILAWTGTADAITSDVVATWAQDGTDPTWATNWTAENTPSNLALTTSAQTFKIENVSLDTAGTTNLALVVWTDDGTITANDKWEIGEFMLNQGEAALPFSAPSVATTLAEAQRFLFRLEPTQSNSRMGLNGFASTTDDPIYQWSFPTMYQRPSFSASNADTFLCGYLGTSQVGTGAVTAASNPEADGMSFTFQLASAVLTAGDSVNLLRDGTDTTYLQLDSRL